MGKFPFKRPRIISKKFPELDSSIDGVTKSLDDLVFSYHEQVNKALSKKHWMMAFSSIALLLVLGSFISQRGKADSSIFYPETCLGGWINPDYSQGEQQTTSNGDETQFTKENSAVLPRNTNAEMYCGNFKGKFDTATKPTKIIVSLALTKGHENAIDTVIKNIETIATTTIIVEVASSTAFTTLIFASSSDKGIDLTATNTKQVIESTSTVIETAIATPGAPKTEAPSVMEGIIKSVQDAISDVFSSSEIKNTQTDTVVVPALEATSTEQPLQQPSITPEQESVVPPSPTSLFQKPASFVSYFVSTVFAEESSTKSSTTLPSVVEKEIILQKEKEATTTEEAVTQIQINKSIPDISPSTEIELHSTSTIKNDSDSTQRSSSTATSTNLEVVSIEKDLLSVATTSPEDHPSQNNFLEVFYTFNGEVWQSLGLLNEISMKYRTFEIPVHASTSWDDMSKLQIRIEARNNDIETPSVFLDGIKVEVLYEGTTIHTHPDFTRDTILKDETLSNIRIVTLINNDNLREEIWYMYLDTLLVSNQEASSTLVLSTSTESTSTQKSIPIKEELTYYEIGTTTKSTSTTTNIISETTTVIASSSSSLSIKPTMQKNVWFKFDGKSQGLLGEELVRLIQKIDTNKLNSQNEKRSPDFSIDIVKKIKGLSLQAIIVQLEKDSIEELWLYNIENNTQEKIQFASTTSVSQTYPLGVKGNYLFWLSNDEAKVYAYNFDSKVVLERGVPIFNGARGERAEVIFEEIPWKIIISSERFSFFSEETGEVFSDDNSTITEEFRKILKLDEVLNQEEFESLNLPGTETATVEKAAQ